MFCFRKPQCALEGNRRKSLNIDKELKRDSKLWRKNVRVLIMGTSGSGKSTVLKQIKITHLDGFTAEERLAKKIEIYGNIHSAIYTLIMNLKRIEMSPSAFKSSTYICYIGPNGPNEFTAEYVQHIRVVWNDTEIQKLYESRYKFNSNNNAKYFLDRLDIVFAPDYVPNHADILHSRTITNGVNEIKLKVDCPFNYNLTFIDIGGCPRTKWVQLFEGVSIILFVVACSTFDELVPITDENRLIESIELFRTIWHNKFLRNSNVILFLNKIDLLEEKLAHGKKISKYFSDYAYFDFKYGHGENVLDITKHFIRSKFEKITSEPIKVDSMFNRKSIMQRECKIHFTVAINSNQFNDIYAKCKQIIMMRALEIYELL